MPEGKGLFPVEVKKIKRVRVASGVVQRVRVADALEIVCDASRSRSIDPDRPIDHSCVVGVRRRDSRSQRARPHGRSNDAVDRVTKVIDRSQLTIVD